MKHLLVLFAGSAAVSVSAAAIRGLDPAHASSYTPSAANTFRCLDGSKEIRFDQINDDYCDCSDGSDEPGTAACHKSTFYCNNKGHRPARIPARNVNDGVCEPSCCDGSDEYGGLVTCPNTCAELAQVAAQASARREAVRNAGLAQRQAWSQTGKQKRLQAAASLKGQQKNLESARKELAVAEAALEALLASPEAHVGQPTTGTPAYEEARVSAQQTLGQLKEAVQGLQAKADAQQERVAALEQILEALKGSYNPNFQDMAVKGAVSAFDELPPVGSTTFPQEATLHELLAQEVNLPAKVCPAAPGSGLASLWQRLRRTLMAKGILAHVAEEAQEQVLESSKVRKAREAVTQQQSQVEASNNEVDRLTKEADQTYLPAGQVTTALKDALRHVTGQTFSTQLGDYTYEVNLLKTLYQKSNSQGNTLIGNFESLTFVPAGVNEADAEADFGATIQLHYTHGTRCWNGPERSGRVDIECGKENKLLSVREAQKCEYVFRVTSPIACSGAGKDDQVKDEL